MRSLFVVFFSLFGAGLALSSCSGESDSASGSGTLCQAGENIFCRCRGGAAGTKTCKSGGQSFEECTTEGGPCTEVEETATSTGTGDAQTTAATTTGATTGAGGASSGTSTSATSGAGGSTPKGYLEVCSSGAECASGLCPMGYCTMTCSSFQDCIVGNDYGDCMGYDIVGVGYNQWCAPYCSSQADCDVYGQPSSCHYALAVDAEGFKVCADWPLDGTDCDSDQFCNLGLLSSERVCAFGACTKGCYVEDDCPLDKVCSSSGALGQCQ